MFSLNGKAQTSPVLVCPYMLWLQLATQVLVYSLISRFTIHMALEAYAAANPDKIHTDVLTKARDSCYNVSPYSLSNANIFFVCGLCFFSLVHILNCWLVFEQGSWCFLCLPGEGIWQEAHRDCICGFAIPSRMQTVQEWICQTVSIFLGNIT